MELSLGGDHAYYSRIEPAGNGQIDFAKRPPPVAWDGAAGGHRPSPFQFHVLSGRPPRGAGEAAAAADTAAIGAGTAGPECQRFHAREPERHGGAAGSDAGAADTAGRAW